MTDFGWLGRTAAGPFGPVVGTVATEAGLYGLGAKTGVQAANDAFRGVTAVGMGAAIGGLFGGPAGAIVGGIVGGIFGQIAIASNQAEIARGMGYCFPGDTPILMADGGVKPIRDILPGDEVLAFDGGEEGGRGALVPRKVVRLFRNVTDEWIVVEAAAEDRAAAARNGFDQITITPGHAVLNEHGAFEKIGDLTARGGRIH